jgi:nitrogen fixation NifU-like protein
VSDDLYNDAIVREAKAGAYTARLPHPDRTVTRDNPLCGDRVTLDLRLEDGHVAEVGHKTRGCLLTQAAAALVAKRGIGATPQEVERVVGELQSLLRGEASSLSWDELTMFRPVAAIKSRHECVLLPFEALAEALAEDGSAG